MELTMLFFFVWSFLDFLPSPLSFSATWSPVMKCTRAPLSGPSRHFVTCHQMSHLLLAISGTPDAASTGRYCLACNLCCLCCKFCFANYCFLPKGVKCNFYACCLCRRPFLLHLHSASIFPTSLFPLLLMFLLFLTHPFLILMYL